MEDVITAITGGIGGVPARSLRSSMERAAVEFDERTAEAFARALFSELSQNPQDLLGLESLIILGLAHPRILARHGISLETEGRRLAVVLERGGQSTRAQQILEMLSQNLPAAAEKAATPVQEDAQVTERVAAIESLLREADQCIARGKRSEAIEKLQQILKLDRDRFDVARMIRDLRREQEDKRGSRATVAKILLSMTIVGALGYVLVAREQRVRDRWEALPQAVGSDRNALQARLDSIQSLLAEEHFWGGVFGAWRERDELQVRIQRIQEDAARAERAATLLKLERVQQAEDIRLRGMLSVKNGHFEEALTDLRQALELGGDNWEQRARVQRDIAAIEAWKAGKP